MAAPAPPALAGANTFYTAPSIGSGLRGIELDRCYQGDIVAGRRHGYGTYTYANSFFKYEGQWENGVKHGELCRRCTAAAAGGLVQGWE
jgi:hypothetical protein